MDEINNLIFDAIEAILKRGLVMRSENDDKAEGLTAEDRQAVLHSHFHREMLVVLRGENRFVIGKSCLTLRAGDYLLVPAGTQHSFGYRTSDRNLIHLWFCFHERKPLFFSYICDENGVRIPSSPLLPASAAPVELLMERWNLLNHKQSGYFLTGKELFDTPIRALLEEILLNQKSINTDDFSAIHVADMIKAQIHSSNGCCSLTDLENACGYSRFYLAHRFKELTGTSIGAYINEVRLKYLSAALQEGKCLKEIGFELGFSSPATFCKWRRKHQFKV